MKNTPLFVACAIACFIPWGMALKALRLIAVLGTAERYENEGLYSTDGRYFCVEHCDDSDLGCVKAGCITRLN